MQATKQHHARQLGALGKLTERLHKLVESPEWRSNVKAQVEVLDELAFLERWQLGPQFKTTLNLMQTSLGISDERWVLLRQLTTKRDLKRALQCNSKPTPQRIGDEVTYPKDGWLGNYLLYAQGGEVPLAWHFWSGVAALGAAARRNIYIDRGSFEIWPNYYLVLVGPQAEKKSQALNTMTDIMRRVNERLEDSGVPDHRRIRVLPETMSPEDFLNAMKTYELTEAEVIAGDLTIRQTDVESVGLMVNDELATLLGKQSFHAEKWVAYFTALYNCPSRWIDSTISSGKRELRNVALTTAFATTPDWIRDSITDAMFNGGYMGRCMFVYRTGSGREIPKPQPLDPIAAQALATDLVRLTELREVEFEVADDFEDYFTHWYHQNKQQVADEPKMIGWYKRKDLQLLKLAMILGLSQGRTRGHLEDIQLAAAILDQEERYLPDCFGELAQHAIVEHKDRILAVLESNGGVMSKSALARKLSNTVGTEKNLHQLLRTLATEGQVTFERPQRGRGQLVKRVYVGEEEW